MLFYTFLLALVLSAVDLTKATATYDLITDYSGESFFDTWDFYGNYDNLTNGDAIFVSQADSASLAYYDSTSGNVIIKVDNTSTVAYNYKRDTVRIASQEQYSVGSLWIADMYHVPYGCSVWPAWWSQATSWPSGGEIDTFEGVNMVLRNQMGLHTTSGCTQVDPVESSTLVNSTDCNYETADNLGCIVTNPSTASYGEGFADADGGVFITEFASSGISVWFFSRADVPSSVSSNSSSMDTSDFGTPVANWPSGGCDIDSYFEAQSLILDITLCGDFAGTASIFNETCTGTCYEDYVVGDGSNYADAYFEIASIRVYSSTSSGSSSGSTGGLGMWTLPAVSTAAIATIGLFIGLKWSS